MWLLNAAMSLVLHRATKSSASGPDSPWLEVLCGLGMGSPAAPLFWAIAYDPVPAGMLSALGIPAPTYVDDLAALVKGAEMATRAAWFLLCASKAIGLKLSCHKCDVLRATKITRDGWDAIAILPVYPAQSQGSWSLPGLPSQTLLRLLSSIAPAWGSPILPSPRPCTCSTKNALVVGGNKTRWEASLAHHPMGPGLLQDDWRYLGPHVAPVPRTRDGVPDWKSPVGSRVVCKTWAKASTTFQARVQVASSSGASLSERVELWNAYVVSLIPFPSLICPPPTGFTMSWAGALQDTLHAHWCKASQLTALGPGLQIRGCPRCPLTASKVAFVRGWLSGRSWGPPGAEIDAASTWNRCTQWARDMSDSPPDPPRGEALSVTRLFAKSWR